MKRILSAVMVLIMACACFPACAFAGETIQESAETVSREAAEEVQTRIEGLMTETIRPASSNIKDTITVTPAGGRAIHLQLYNARTGTWNTKKEFLTGPGKKEKVVITYPGDWKKANSSRWRISMDAENGGTAYVSPEINIMTRNRKKLKLSSKSAIIMEKNSGQIFYGKGMNTRRANASTTKMMTAILALENRRWNSNVKLSRKAVKTSYTTLKYKKGDIVKMKDLLYAALVLSDNGSATALAEHTAGSVSAFCEMMNKKARELGCENTHFVNPHGLDDKNHYSSAGDLAIIGAYVMNNSRFQKIVKTRKYGFKTLKKKKTYRFNSTNKLLVEISGVTGIKTGTTENAGCCFVGAYRYKGKDYITVVLGAGKTAQRWKDTKTLISYIRRYI